MNNTVNYAPMHNQVRFGYKSNLKKLANAGLADCAYCGKAFTKKNFATLEHIQPHSKHGASNVSNYLPVHMKCNQRRGNMDFTSYLAGHKNAIGFIQKCLDRLRGQVIDGRDYISSVVPTLNKQAKGMVHFHGKLKQQDKAQNLSMNG